MFRKAPRSSGGTGEQLGLWEFAAESEATEMINRHQDKKDRAEPPEQARLLPNFARQVHWGRK